MIFPRNSQIISRTVKVDGITMNDVISFDIEMTEKAFCPVATVYFKGMENYALCNPDTNYGTARLEIIINHTQISTGLPITESFKFLIEERSESITKSDFSFSLKGREVWALLGKGYADAINDNEDSTWIWQDWNPETGTTCTAQQIIDEMINLMPVEMSINNFLTQKTFAIKKGSINAQGLYPIDLMKKILETTGYDLIRSSRNNIAFWDYTIDETDALIIIEYTDVDDIIELSGSREINAGHDSVTVYGYGNIGDPGEPYPTDSSWQSSSTAIIEVQRKNSKPIYPSNWFELRIYHFHALNASMLFYANDSNLVAQSIETGTESINETVNLTWGNGSTSKINERGVKSILIEGDIEKPFSTASVDYSAPFTDFRIRTSTVGNNGIAFYYEDKSALTVHNFTVETVPAEIESEPDTDITDICAGYVIDAPDSYRSGAKIVINIYYPDPFTSNPYPKPATDWITGGTFEPLDKQETKTEIINFSSGTGQTEFPISQINNISAVDNNLNPILSNWQGRIITVSSLQDVSSTDIEVEYLTKWVEFSMINTNQLGQIDLDIQVPNCPALGGEIPLKPDMSRVPDPDDPSPPDPQGDNGFLCNAKSLCEQMCGCWNETTATCSIPFHFEYSPEIIGVDFSYNINVGEPSGFTVDFVDDSTGNPIDWYWDFGDGSTSDEQNPTHTYSEIGVYQAILRACNASCSCDALMKKNIIVPLDCDSNKLYVYLDVGFMYTLPPDGGVYYGVDYFGYSYLAGCNWAIALCVSPGDSIVIKSIYESAAYGIFCVTVNGDTTMYDHRGSASSEYVLTNIQDDTILISHEAIYSGVGDIGDMNNWYCSEVPEIKTPCKAN